ncbi:hypothetical protein J437_LFUL015370 [Ladona fulva]|uniref:Dehydrogenase/reductase SDR family member 7 n=1 Tax=Ladona fulva TaxID=123851 RepID=A0A8K0NVB4_LADFU|nr:hypothetical protein J437_LFUL015370 [Ladona fulva]
MQSPKMDLLALIGLAMLCYFFAYVIFLSFLDCDLRLAWAEKFGKPIDSVRGKVIWVTGASSGIGEATAVALASGGAQLVISARRESELERVKNRCIEEGKLKGEDIYVLPMDVTVMDKHQEYFDDVIRKFGKLDMLVSNAGRSQRANWEEIETAVDQEMFELNVFSVMSLTRIAVKYFLTRKEGGHVAVTSSIAGVLGVPFSGSYNGAKHALHKYGADASASDRRLTADRCGYLCAVALANGLREAWMALPPVLPLTYLGCYYPNAGWM